MASKTFDKANTASLFKPQKRAIRRIASTLLLQSTALAGTMAGIPLAVYSRAYAQATCKNSGINEYTCSIQSDTTLTTTQYVYGGGYAFYQNVPTHEIRKVGGDRYDIRMTNQGEVGRGITLFNSADIVVSGNQPGSSSMLAPRDGTDSSIFRWSSYADGLSVLSAGTGSFESGRSGDGGRIAISSYGATVSSETGGGIYALSQGGSSYATEDGGHGNDIRVATSPTVSGKRFGIAALSIGGYAAVRDEDSFQSMGQSGDVTIYVTGDRTVRGPGRVEATSSGPAILGVSYSPDTQYSIRFGRILETGRQRTNGGQGGGSGDVNVSVGSSNNPFSGTIETHLPGHLREKSLLKQSEHITRETGSAIAAFSVGGSGAQAGVTKHISGGSGGDVNVEVTGTTYTNLLTAGENSSVIHAYSGGGYAFLYMKRSDPDANGGNGGSVSVKTTGGGTIQNGSSLNSFGILAQSLAGGNGVYNNKVYGTPGKAGSVQVDNGMNIAVGGAYNSAILAQSAPIAGGAMFTNRSEGILNWKWGSQAGHSVPSGEVTVNNTSTLNVSGRDAHGIHAQSLGGVGGVLTSTAKLSTKNGAVTPGAQQNVGTFTSAAHGAAVYVTNHGAIQTGGGTFNHGGIGILAQSIGGGGGTNFGTGAVSAFGGTDGTIDEGSQGSNGDTVDVRSYAAIRTFGDEGHGILAQSIGGGGGAGRNHKGFLVSVGGNGGNGGDAGESYIRVAGNIRTSGRFAAGSIAQSIGGGGGQGGKDSAWALGIPAVSIGGQAGGGGNGAKAEVRIEKSAEIMTTGDHALAAHAQSVGGGGGNGGAAKSWDGSGGLAVSVAVGGGGGNGGAAGEAFVHHYGTIVTKGDDAGAILSQSIGGGGGQGGTATAKAIAEGVPVDEDLNTVSVSLAIGSSGDGGDGGDSGEAIAIVEKGSTITTSGAGATAVHIQSIAGGGGAGGDATATSVSKSLSDVIDKLKGGDDDDDDDSKQYNVDVTLTIGGAGGSSGTAARAYGHVLGQVTTSGDLADGLLIQSVGGGGGAGGAGSGTATPVDKAVSGTLNIVVGGDGSGGGDGGKVQGGLSDTGSITTKGVGSRGLVAQSVGGGGGVGGGGTGNDGATWSVNVALGNRGGQGGNGGTVYAWNAGTITTSGDDAHGILAQSIAGGGGAAGLGTSSITHTEKKKKADGGKDSGTGPALLADSSDTKTTTYLTVGNGLTAAGGVGGVVTVGRAKSGGALKKGTIITTGDISHGVLAQSIGGGGGAGAVSNSSQKSASSTGSDDKPDVSVTLGSESATGGNALDVKVFASSVTTSGFGSSAIVAQSIGGGGGTATSTGFAVPKLGLTIGSNGPQPLGGTGATVDVYVLSGETLKTEGDSAHGVVAQSVGGGGGLSIIALGTEELAHDDSLSDVITLNVGSAITESYAGPHAFGNDVKVDHKGTIETSGTRSIGIVAQSIGAGGGFLSASKENIAGINWVGSQSAAPGGNVTVSLEGGSIVTSGDGAFGILAQSISGGGGAVADFGSKAQIYAGSTFKYRETVTDEKSFYPAYTSGTVSVTLDKASSITTSGEYAHGVFAQSLAGSGGIFTRNGTTYAGSLGRNTAKSNDASVTVNVDGTITTQADSAWGVWAQAQDGTVDLNVAKGGTVNGSSTSEGTGGAVLAAVDGSGHINIANDGTIAGNIITSVGGVQNWNRNDSAGSVESPADGVITLRSAPGTARLVNTGTFRMGRVVSVDTVLNAGTLTIGEAGDFGTTTIHGDLVGLSDDPGGVLSRATAGLGKARSARSGGAATTSGTGARLTRLDVDMAAGTTDRLVVEGDLAGTWTVEPHVATLLPNVRADFLKVGGTNTSRITVADSLVFDFSEVNTAPNGATGFTVDARFHESGVALSRNEQEIVRGLQEAWDTIAEANGTAPPGGDGPNFGEVFGAFHTATEETFDDMVASLTSHTGLGPLARAPSMAVATANAAISCEGFASGAIVEEGSCMWATVNGANARYDGYDGDPGFAIDSYGLSGGVQIEFAESWFAGGVLGYENGRYRGNGNGQSLNTDTAFGALSIKRELGGFTLGLAAGGGYTWGDGSRVVANGAFVGRAEASPNSSYVFARAHGDYTYAFSDWGYLRPAIDLDVINVNQEAYEERGAGALNLAVEGGSDTFVVFTPSLELGGRVNLTPSLPARVFANAGVSVFSEDTFTVNARFAGLPTMDTFETTTSIGDALARVGVGIDLAPAEGLEVKLQYDGAFSDKVQSHGGSLRLGYRF
ncbi:autotransporter outer membrane beta-barrel domain-containing protein [Acuticoccus sp. M5D2P5]|uniref:autotransporter outer membrane beta-barrel domain-containing protein n=1 Tax=Acuticoccus kalidii TaxID=2910977 RepID=UPI001F38A103|nr:autotransporter outer membrane beta-barrel domain-containing protein [Acuticoccus kalidii]MCF3933415.1 autotransporter outer membrane beta-barrel domain-containing protein [Acuticoccus kalidii]